MTRKESAIAHVVASSDYGPRFPGWLFEHWEVYVEFERLALTAIARGRLRLSAKFLFELIRWNTAIREEGEPYKINNTHAADCARLFERLNHSKTGFFEFRQRSREVA